MNGILIISLISQESITDGGTRPQSAPASQQYKKSRKDEREAKLKEKERLRTEKEAIKNKKEVTKRMEKEAARLEKLSRSNERLGGRSGSLERRKSGEDGPVINQSTIHGEFDSDFLAYVPLILCALQESLHQTNDQHCSMSSVRAKTLIPRSERRRCPNRLARIGTVVPAVDPAAL